MTLPPSLIPRPPHTLFQSLVLISRLPYLHLFHIMLQIIAPEFFDKLEPCLEAGDGAATTTVLRTNQSDRPHGLTANVLWLQCATRLTGGRRLCQG